MVLFSQFDFRLFSVLVQNDLVNESWGAVDDAAEQLTEQLGKNVLMTGSQLALRKRDAAHILPEAKCPFTPQREMVMNLWGEKLA